MTLLRDDIILTSIDILGRYDLPRIIFSIDSIYNVSLFNILLSMLEKAYPCCNFKCN